MTHALVTFLGKGRDDPRAGYRETTYCFPDGTRCATCFFGLALARHLAVDRAVILGTPSSMWGVLVEHVAAEGEEEDARLALMEAEAAGCVEQRLLDQLSNVLRRAVGREVAQRVIPFGRTDSEQRDILKTISTMVGPGEVSFDLTHGFRHLGMVGMLSAFMLERIGRLGVHSLWYGALDMTKQGVAPVLRLDGLNAIQRWVDALDRFDASGDYGVFAPLLEADGVPADKARCLREAAFFERTFNLSDAARKLQTFRIAMRSPLNGTSRLFQEQLEQRLKWIDERDPSAQQRKLFEQYLGRNDFVRAAMFAWEALISRYCAGYDWYKWKERKAAADALKNKVGAADCETEWGDAYRTINSLRNALAHGTPPEDPCLRDLLASPEKLRAALQGAVDRLLAPSQACGSGTASAAEVARE
jgi:CRISPR-associated Csx2 family protein